MKILFLGGTGNISSACAALLQQKGHAIFVLTRGRSDVPAEYTSIVADRTDVEAMRGAVRKAAPDIVINFIGFDVPDVRTDFEVFSGSIAQYVFISSTTVYQKPAPILPMTEETPLENQWWDYAQKKIACEKWLREKNEREHFPLTIVRPSHTYSKRWVPNPIASSSYTFAARIRDGKPIMVPDEGENPWTMTAASDFAEGLAGLVANPRALHEAVHITSDEVLTWNTICHEIQDACNELQKQHSRAAIWKIPTDFICEANPDLAGNLKGDKSCPAVFDNSKIKRLVPGFSARKTFRQGVRESVEWLEQNPDQQNLNPKVDEMIERVIDRWRTSLASGSRKTN
jgi:nucleoside-diphosphate-sugar epimerase